MRSYVKIFIPVVLAILLGSLTVIFAQTPNDKNTNGGGKQPGDFGPQGPPPPHGKPDSGPGRHTGLPPHVLEQLDLTDDQITKIGRLRDGAYKEEKPYFEKLRTADNKLRELGNPDSFNESEARQVLSAKAQVTTELELIRLRTESEIYSVLTPEQISQVEILKQQRPERPLPPAPPAHGFFTPPAPPAN